MSARAKTAKMQKIADRDGGWRCHYCHINLISPETPRELVYNLLPDGLVSLKDPDRWQWPYADHKIPRARGGKTTIDNLVLACISCNSRKGARHTYEKFYAMTAPLRAANQRG